MKYLTTLSLLLLGLSFTHGQNPKHEIAQTLDAYFALVEQQNVAEMLDHVHPKLIGMVDKALFEQQYDQTFNDPNVAVWLMDFSQDSISAVYVHASGNYALVQYSFKLRMTVKTQAESPESGKAMLSMYQRQYGKENVVEEAAGSYLISASREMFACQEPEFEGWKILDYEPGMKIMLSQFIAADVFEHFNK